MSGALESSIVLKDRYTPVVKNVVKNAQNLNKALDGTARQSQKTERALKSLVGKKYDIKIKQIGDKRIQSDVKKLQNNLRKTTGKPYKLKIEVKKGFAERAKSQISSIKAAAKNIRMDIKGTVRAKMEAAKLSRELTKSTGRRHKIRIDKSDVDRAESKVRGLRSGLSNLKGGMGGMASKLGLVGAGMAAAYGTGRAVSSMVRGGAELEQQKISMVHWTGGDQKKSNQYLKQLRGEANKTPFETGEVVQAGARALGITNGNTKKGMELVKMAEDMAALSPGKTVMDAMEALADAQMGEMERMKEFGFKGSKEDLDAVGGDLTKLKNKATGKTIGETFSGGASKLANSAGGKWSTVKGNIQSGMADAGLKILKSLSPALGKLVPISEKIAKKVPPIIDKIINGAGAVFKILAPGFKAVGSALKPLGPAFRSIAKKSLPVFKLALKGVALVLKALSVPIKLVTSGFKAVVSGLSSLAEKLRNWNPINKLKNFVEGKTAGKSKGKGKGKSGISFQFIGRGMSKRHATGSSYYLGGSTTLNELGSEMFTLPKGTKIYPASKTKKEMEKIGRSHTKTVYIQPTINITGAKDPTRIGDEVEKALRRLSVNMA